MRYARYLLLIDADVVITGRVDDVFEAAKRGVLVAYRDRLESFDFKKVVALRGRALEKAPVTFNSGFVCIDTIRHWDLVGLWAFAVHHQKVLSSTELDAPFAGYGDQGVLNTIGLLLGKEHELKLFDGVFCCTDSANLVVKVSERSDQLRTYRRDTGQQIRVLHSAGPKWWMAASDGYAEVDLEFREVFRFFRDRPIPYPLGVVE